MLYKLAVQDKRMNERLSLTPGDLLEIFEGHYIARKKLKYELLLFMQGERAVRGKIS